MIFPRSNAKTLDNIRPRKQNRNPNVADRRQVIGFDTETDTDGNIFLVCDSNGDFVDYPDISFGNLAKFFLKYEGKWVFCYNLGYDATCILKLLPKEILDSYKLDRKLKFNYKEYEIHYIPNKQLTIRKGNHSVNFYDIAQYFDRKPLAEAYSKNIGKTLDPEYLQMKEKREDFSLSYYLRHKKQMRRYCIADCILTKDLAEKWLDTFHEVFSFYPRNWVSSGYLAEKVLINYEIYIPRFNETDYAVQELARKCFYGGRFELIKKGFIGKCYLYDINSAYPFALTTVPDILDGKWISGTEIHPKAKLGFFHIIADIDFSVKICPFPFRKKNGTIVYPFGKFETFVTLEELKSVEGDPRIKYTILESHQFIPNKNCEYPFKKYIEDLYNRRMKLRDEGNKQEQAIKIILNSTYGKTAQTTNNQFGNLFNPIISASITGFARAQLYRFMKEHDLENNIVAFATDSIATTKKIPDLDSKKLGEMKLDKEGNDVYYLSNGYYRFNEKWKNRGIGNDPDEKNVEIEHLGTEIGKDGQLYIEVQTTQMQHLKSGIIRNLHKSIGKIRKYKKKVYLNSDRKRKWDKSLEKIDDQTCDSIPINMNMEGKMISKEHEIDWYEEEKYEPESDI